MDFSVKVFYYSGYNILINRTVTSRFIDEASERKIVGTSKLEDQIFIHKNTVAPCVMQFHPVNPVLVVADNENVRYVYLSLYFK